MLSAPLRLDPVLVAKPWGGDRLRRFGRAVEEGASIGESWDVADLAAGQSSVPDPVSRIETGDHAGRALADVIASDREALLGEVAPTTAGRFPLLVKLLDAREDLSVQVHPPRSLAPDDFKTESWVVLDALPGARLLLGVDHGVTPEQVDAALGTAELLPLLRSVPVEVGDVVHLPAGTLHALGAGVLVAEVQTTSDTTYRVWDWPEERGGGRELHVDEARRAVAAGWEHNLHVEVARAQDGVLVETDAYVLAHETLAAGQPLAAAAQDGAPRVVVVTTGTLRWQGEGGEQRLGPGGVVLLPAACTTPLLAGSAEATVVVATPR